MASRYQVGAWSHGLCDCFNNIGTCVATLFCPCVMFGQTAEKIGSGSCVICGASLLFPPFNLISRMVVRGNIREAKGIDGNGLNDFLLIFFCPFCSLVQEVQECDDMSPSAQSMCRN